MVAWMVRSSSLGPFTWGAVGDSLIPPHGEPMSAWQRICHVRTGAQREVEVTVAVEIGQLQRGVTRKAGLQNMADEHAGLRLLQTDKGSRRCPQHVAGHDGRRKPCHRNDVLVAVAIDVAGPNVNRQPAGVREGGWRRGPRSASRGRTRTLREVPGGGPQFFCFLLSLFFAIPLRPGSGRLAAGICLVPPDRKPRVCLSAARHVRTGTHGEVKIAILVKVGQFDGRVTG